MKKMIKNNRSAMMGLLVLSALSYDVMGMDETARAMFSQDSYLGYLLLSRAIANGDLERVNEAIALGVDVNNTGAYDKSTCLMEAASFNEPIVLALLRAGADVNAQNDRGSTALMAAVKSNDIDMVQVLLAAGADVDMQDNQGRKADDDDFVTSAAIRAAIQKKRQANMSARSMNDASASSGAAFDDL